tara:strand:- start:1575 stop:2534 length:960 start_codon:yes stop_codon:yes gene_type:complete
MNLNLALLYGGTSSERSVSLKTGEAVKKVLSSFPDLNLFSFDFNNNFDALLDFIISNSIDLVFIALHGGDGEDGTIQAFLEKNDIDYTGSNASASKIAMDKNLTKKICLKNALPTARWTFLDLDESRLDISLLLAEYGESCVVKPANDGSSIGMSVLDNKSNKSSLLTSINKCKEISSKIIIEEYINGRELTVGIIDGLALPIVEIVPNGEFYDYKSKYAKNGSSYIVPAILDLELEDEIQEYAETLYELVGCQHYARVDFLLADDGRVYILEINTLPGLTDTSLLPKAYNEEFKDFCISSSKTTYDLLILEIIKLALK